MVRGGDEVGVFWRGLSFVADLGWGGQCSCQGGSVFLTLSGGWEEIVGGGWLYRHMFTVDF